MKKRTVLYGYQIQHGDFVVVPAEQAIVKRIFVDYHRRSHSIRAQEVGINIR